MTAPGWMVTFADLLSLLLAFFVMLFATTSVEPAEWHRVMAPIALSFAGGIAAPQSTTASVRPPPPTRDPAYIRSLFAQLVATSRALAGTGLQHRGDSLVVTLPDFASEEARTAALTDLGRVVGGIDNRAELVVHTAADTAPGTAAVELWRRPLAAAATLADTLAASAGNRPIEPHAAADLAAGRRGATGDRIELVIHDTAGGGDHGAR